MNFFREKKEHMAFGYGPHRCMGGETGQLQAEVVIEKLLFADVIQGKKELSNIKLLEFDWEIQSSFKEIHAIKIQIIN